MSYLLSIVIPTKERYKYLKECVQSLVDISSEELEIVVQDNTTDNTEIKEFLENMACPHIKYYHDTRNLSQTQNSELAVEHATGEYMCYIGDDDSVSSYILNITRIIKENHIKAFVCNVATYHWEDVVFEGKKKAPLFFDARVPKAIRLDAREVLNGAMKWGMQDIKYLARIYHGVVSKAVMDKVKEATGSYFPGPSPDMANAVAVTSILDNYIYVRLPLIISGYSFKSAGGMGLRGAHKGKLKDAKQLSSDVESKWNPLIPKIWLGYTIWPESALKALQSMNNQKYDKKINYYAMYAKIFLRYPEYRQDVKKFGAGFWNNMRLYFECVRFMCRWFYEKIKIFFRTACNKQFKKKEQISLEEACHIVDNFIDKYQVEIERI